MTIYLGPVGNLQALPYMGRGIGASLDLGAAVQRSLGGPRTVDYIGAPRRTYQLTRDFLSADEIGTLEALALGAYGPGPLVLLDPWRRNLLTANQASGTDVLGDTTGFVAFSGAISSTLAAADLGLRSVAHAVTTTAQEVAIGSLATNTADPNTDTPVRPSIDYTAQVRGRLSTSTGSVRIDLRWYTSAGVFISAAVGTAVALNTASFTTVTVSGTAPAAAALARFLLRNTASGGAQTIYYDQWQLEQGVAASPWVPGTGVPRVAFIDLGDTYPLGYQHDVSIGLQEVG